MTIRIPGDVGFSPCAFCEPDDYRPIDAEPRVRLILKRCSKAHAWALILGVDFELDDGIATAELVTKVVQKNVTCVKTIRSA